MVCHNCSLFFFLNVYKLVWILKKVSQASFNRENTVKQLGYHESGCGLNPESGVLQHLTLKIKKTLRKSFVKQLKAFVAFRGSQNYKSWSCCSILLKILVTRQDNHLGGDISIAKVVVLI